MADSLNEIDGPHRGQRVLAVGEPLARARLAMVMVHGRGADAQDILSLAPQLARPGFAYLAPEAAGNTWYPNSFLAPIASNEPYLSSALALLDTLVAQVVAAGIPLERTMLLGFSQGACLTLEYAARHAQRYGGVVGWTGGLIGPDDTPRDYAGSLAGTPVFLGCSDADFHIPKPRVDLTAAVLQQLGGAVTKRIYPNMGHTVNQDEVDFVREMMVALDG
ncbi:MAG TPA: dienelactone hydrolase family protein [Ktedonobacterales bacterium]|nr:dienelactone hydrolase family protein [Ktedonobacterales bacterium]